jgi:hypothetical protein
VQLERRSGHRRISQIDRISGRHFATPDIGL